MRTPAPPLSRLLGVALLLASCRAKTPPVAPRDAGAPPAPMRAQAPSGSARADAAPQVEPRYDGETPEQIAQRVRLTPLARRIDRLLSKKGGCVSDLDEAGRDHKGQALFVATQGEDCFVPEAHEAKMDPSRHCQTYRYTLVASKGSELRALALLAESCIPFEERGAHGGHMTGVAGKKQIFREARAASVWGEAGGNTTVELGLDPLRVVSLGKDNQDVEDWTWNWDAFEGKATWTAIDCKAQARGTGPDGGPEKANPTYTIGGVLIPSVSLPDDFIAHRWRTTGLGRCAALVDGGQRGHTVHGSVGPPGDATLRAMLTDAGESPTLFVEVSDDRFVGPGRSWVTDDHLELWVGEAKLGEERACGQESTEWIAQWGIRVADGAVFAAHGGPPPLVGVERVVVGHTARFKIPMPERRGDRLTVVYSDSDDGRRQKSLIATSELRFGDPGTLGDSHATNASCTVKGGELQPKPIPLAPSLTKAATSDLF
jgi:hypothetical protein